MQRTCMFHFDGAFSDESGVRLSLFQKKTLVYRSKKSLNSRISEFRLFSCGKKRVKNPTHTGNDSEKWKNKESNRQFLNI